jgi:hypothetical protein
MLREIAKRTFGAPVTRAANQDREATSSRTARGVDERRSGVRRRLRLAA